VLKSLQVRVAILHKHECMKTIGFLPEHQIGYERCRQEGTVA
jgi:hypothetical protein